MRQQEAELFFGKFCKCAVLTRDDLSCTLAVKDDWDLAEIGTGSKQLHVVVNVVFMMRFANAKKFVF